MRISNEQHKTDARQSCGKVQSAFSLIELLVVIAVIALLAALILTAVLAAKKRIQQAQCGHNVGQLGLGVQLFVTDNHVYPLQVNTGYRKGSYPEHQTAWTTALEGILARVDPVKLRP